MKTCECPLHWSDETLKAQENFVLDTTRPAGASSPGVGFKAPPETSDPRG